MKIWGSSFQYPVGYVAKLGTDKHNHCFGGGKWKISTADQDGDSVSLLLGLDLEDERFLSLNTTGLAQLPLASHLNNRAWEVPQSYRIDPLSKQLIFDSIGSENRELLAVNGVLSLPLPCHKVSLQVMDSGDYPVDEDNYWSACDGFVGGDRFIRVLGPPLWLQDPEVVICKCSDPMAYVCSIGYQNYEQGSGFVDGAFFIGEAALYFFYCKKCLRVNVLSQST